MAWALPVAYGVGALTNLVSGYMNKRAIDQANNANVGKQEEFARMGIQWRVADAKAAGVHPIYAMGANIPSFSPSVMAGDSGYISDMGQNIGRAIAASEEPSQFERRRQILQLENDYLQNMLLTAQIAQLTQAPSPGLPSNSGYAAADSMGGSGYNSRELPNGPGVFQEQPNRPIAREFGNPAKEAGSVSDYGYATTNRGYRVVASMDVKQRTEDNPIEELKWSLRYNMSQAMDPEMLQATKPNLKLFPPSVFGKGFNDYYWDTATQEWVAYKKQPGEKDFVFQGPGQRLYDFFHQAEMDALRAPFDKYAERRKHMLMMSPNKRRINPNWNTPMKGK